VFRTITAYVLIGLSLLVCIPAVIFWFNPYTDAQVQASLVDTWEPEALVTIVLLSLLAFVLLLSVLLWLFSFRSSARWPASAAVAASLGSACLVFAIHAAFSIHVTKLTGQSFGRAFGLLHGG
jgi:glucan phosphoethanolaminetransferase (alkaline phosphatase superfamily)